MKVNITEILSAEFKENFFVKEGEINKIPCLLINPRPDVKWTKENIVFRSSIWDFDGNLISASFKKFVNMFENPDVFPPPKDLNKSVIVDKKDGSTFICDLINGKLNVRTRGTLSYSTLDNAVDFKYTIDKYPQISTILEKFPNYTLLFEITTPSNRIIIDYGKETEIHLIGIIDKDTYDMVYQFMIDQIADIFRFKRPEKYFANSVDELIAQIKSSKGIEGCCVYVNNDQDIFKIKSDYWLKLNGLKNDLGSFDRLVALYLSLEDRNYDNLEKHIISNFDFEILEFCKDNLEKLKSFIDKAEKICQDISMFISLNNLTSLSRKEAAYLIIEHYSDFKGAAFRILDGAENRESEETIIKTLIK
jgi:hypothetical protein